MNSVLLRVRVGTRDHHDLVLRARMGEPLHAVEGRDEELALMVVTVHSSEPRRNRADLVHARDEIMRRAISINLIQARVRERLVEFGSGRLEIFKDTHDVVHVEDDRHRGGHMLGEVDRCVDVELVLQEKVL